MEHLPSGYSLFASLLEYPTPALLQHAEQCGKLLSQSCPAAGEVFGGFNEWVKQESLPRIEEIYTSTFDLQGVCCPYVGHHLFGDTYQRSWFMARLNQGYHAKGFSSGSELPDHLEVILRFLGQDECDEFSQVLVQEGLFPALGKMVTAFDTDGRHPYGLLLKSLILLLQEGNINDPGSKVKVERGGVAND